ncbi:CoA pyrophosphatase [Leucobacter rhizosphaerae]|uniref:CoA pyrophosphatase n=1 Tax=Leucobacter rhizosphaerae TaxID=2932245 RepID=A0ABY4FZQ5_9MICO|nr:CoA pyrophosphatase [Leucobacter rhizosphaerae]UOQ61752.1 CoA pyrophosphatase [Leucobacter rhizosphaerae]
MSGSVTQAQEQLRALLQRGITLDIAAQGGLGDTPVRRSSVLILFGALDRTPAVDARSVQTIPPELDVLLTMRAAGMRHHAGQIAFPGGGAEPEDADVAATALREATEETGLDASGVEVLGALPEVHIPVSNNLVTPVVGWWTLPSEIAADSVESVEVFRAPVAELLDPSARGTSVLDRGGMHFRGPAFRLGPRFGGQVVWGFTGILLATLFDELGWAVPWDASREFPVRP